MGPTKYATGEYVQVRLSEASVPSGELALVAEMRRMADGRVFLGVSVRPEFRDGPPVLSWSNLGDPSSLVLPVAAHVATVVADLCAALEGYAGRLELMSPEDVEAADDLRALAAGRLLLSSAAFQRAIGGAGDGGAS